MNKQTIEITQQHVDLIQPVIDIATKYERIMDNKRKLGITGEVGEIKACLKFGLKLMLDSQSAGYDAIDNDGKKVQIKTRRSELGKKLTNPTRLSSFSRHEFDYCLLLLLDKDYEIDEIWRAEANTLKSSIERHERRNPTLGAFKRVAKRIFNKNDEEK
jgi:hypothetical protein